MNGNFWRLYLVLGTLSPPFTPTVPLMDWTESSQKAKHDQQLGMAGGKLEG